MPKHGYAPAIRTGNVNGSSNGRALLDFEVREQTNFALIATVGTEPRSGRLFLRVNGDTHGVTDTQAREYANAYLGVLSAIARSPEQAIVRNAR